MSALMYVPDNGARSIGTQAQRDGVDMRRAGHNNGMMMTPSPSPAAANGSSRIRCFLVEDSPVIRENLIATLHEMLDIEVLGHASDESSAIAWLTADDHACELVIIDVFLKSGSGLGVLSQLRPRLSDAHFIVLTNFATQDMRQRCLQLGADAVFDKSAELEEMLAYCESLCTRS